MWIKGRFFELETLGSTSSNLLEDCDKNNYSYCNSNSSKSIGIGGSSNSNNSSRNISHYTLR